MLEFEVSFFGIGEEFGLCDSFLCLSPALSFEVTEAEDAEAVTGEVCLLLCFSLCLFSGLGEVDGVCAVFSLGVGVKLWLLG